MPATSLTGSASATINGTVLATLADGRAFDITFPNELAQVKAGKNGNTIYAKNELGRVADVSVRVLRGNADDKMLNSLLQTWLQDAASFNLITGMFVETVNDGAGNLSAIVYNCAGGIFLKQVEMFTSAEGDTEQSVSVYTLRFGNCQVSIQ